MPGMKSVVKNALMRSYLASGMPSARDRVAAQMGRSRLTVITYHQVKDPADDGSSVGVAAFREQMGYLRRHYQVVRLEDGVARLQRGRTPERLVSITFDDGYEDNYRNAFPILERYGLPATVFLTTGSIDSGEPLWFASM